MKIGKACPCQWFVSGFAPGAAMPAHKKLSLLLAWVSPDIPFVFTFS